MPATRRSKKPKSQQPRERAPPPPPPPSEQTGSDDDGKPVYFWKPHETPYGVFSQWYDESFTAPIDGVEITFATAEQYMMYRKALLFNDASAAAEILETKDPRQQRALGRKVRDFDEETWTLNRSPIVEEGSYWKFKRDPGVLIATGQREIVEASPRDKVWGIGRGAATATAEEGRGRKNWGLNLLGKALMVARDRLRNETAVEIG